MNITNHEDEQAAHKLADALLHNCSARERAIKVGVACKAMWECWTCGKQRHVRGGSDSAAWFNDLALRDAASILKEKGY